MKAQLQVARAQLDEARELWKRQEWQQAYRVALEAQEAMDRAQGIYNSVFGTRSH